MLINFDCSCLWVKDKFMLTKALSVDPIYLRYKEMDKAIDYRVIFFDFLINQKRVVVS